MPAIDEALERWTTAGVLDEATAERIRVFEAAHEHPTGLRWQVLLALIFGAILLASGISLFVAAHWDELSPAARFTVAVGTLVLLHALAIFVRPRFESLSIALHGIGTAAAGGAIALVGQIFNLQEHWPAAILLWALCALAGWWLLGDQVQQTIALLLIPAWLICEWMVRTEDYQGSRLFMMRLIAVFAAVYLTGFINEKRKAVSGILFGVSAAALVTGVAWLSFDHGLWSFWPQSLMPTNLVVFEWICLAVLPLLAAWRLQPSSVLPVGMTLVCVILLPHLYSFDVDRYPYGHPQETLLTHIVVAVMAAFLAWWGVQQRSRAVTNYGVICFAIAVLWFYVSKVMGKLERSLSLIVLGVLFLGGGWLLEKMRRRLVRRIEERA